MSIAEKPLNDPRSSKDTAKSEETLLGVNLLEFCRSLGLTPEEYRERGGIKERTWAAWVSGESAPTIEGWKSLAKGAGCGSTYEFGCLFGKFWADRRSALDRQVSPEGVVQMPAPYLRGAAQAENGREQVLLPSIQMVLAPITNLPIEVSFSKRWQAPLADSKARIFSLMAMLENEIARFLSLYFKYKKNSPEE